MSENDFSLFYIAPAPNSYFPNKSRRERERERGKKKPLNIFRNRGKKIK
jgi:hypothetical protein